MIKAEINMKESHLAFSAHFDSSEEFAQEIHLLLCSLMNDAVYHACDGDIEKGEKAIEILKDLVRSDLDINTCLRNYVKCIEGWQI